MTRLGANRIHPVRVRGGNIKYRALRLEAGNFSWGSEATTRKSRLLVVVYNASNNELVRTNTLVKNAIIQIDATPFRQWYEQHYGIALGKKKKEEKAEKKSEKKGEKKPAPKKKDEKKEEGQKKDAKSDTADAPKEGDAAKAQSSDKKSRSVKCKLAKRRRGRTLDPALAEQFNSGRLLAAISSRPGQCGRCDGYILEGDELAFYLKKIHAKKKGKTA